MANRTQQVFVKVLLNVQTAGLYLRQRRQFTESIYIKTQLEWLWKVPQEHMIVTKRWTTFCTDNKFCADASWPLQSQHVPIVQCIWIACATSVPACSHCQMNMDCVSPRETTVSSKIALIGALDFTSITCNWAFPTVRLPWTLFRFACFCLPFAEGRNILCFFEQRWLGPGPSLIWLSCFFIVFSSTGLPWCILVHFLPLWVNILSTNDSVAN